MQFIHLCLKWMFAENEQVDDCDDCCKRATQCRVGAERCQWIVTTAIETWCIAVRDAQLHTAQPLFLVNAVHDIYIWPKLHPVCRYGCPAQDNRLWPCRYQANSGCFWRRDGSGSPVGGAFAVGWVGWGIMSTLDRLGQGAFMQFTVPE